MNILVTGGARSGKSSYAESLYKDNEDVTYLATYINENSDLEMIYRIQKHQAQRSLSWNTIEMKNSLDIKADKVLLDCLSIYTSNIMYHYTKDMPIIDYQMQSKILDHIMREVKKLLDNCAHVVIVTNEVGSATVPHNHLERVYRDLLGRVNQEVAKLVDEVYLVVCGYALQIK